MSVAREITTSRVRSGLGRKYLVSLLLIAAILSAAILTSYFFLGEGQAEGAGPVKSYVGVAFCGNTTEEARLLIDRVRNYTNLLVLQSGPVSKNETATNEICDYAVAAGLKIIVYFGDLNPRFLTNQTLWRVNWVSTARQRWNSSLLGVYYYDEPGGIWLDTDWSLYPRAFNSNSTYASAANIFTVGFQRDRGTIMLKNNSIPIAVSDWALYWFDYLSGYDIVLAQAGWNHTMQQDVALVRGAASAQNKTWGMMITWKYTASPYLATGEEILGQMVDAYAAGAKYIVLFNYPQIEGNPYGAMKDEHFRALEEFWKETFTNSSVQSGATAASTALVLPSNYGWGMRNPNDTIWGMWGPDEKSPMIWNISRTLLSQYGYHLDIVYDDPRFPVEGKYERVCYWNETIRPETNR